MERVSTLKLAASAAASWAWGVGLLVGMEIARTKGLVVWLIWAIANCLTLALFGYLRQRGVLNRKVMNFPVVKIWAIITQLYCLVFQVCLINDTLIKLGVPSVSSYIIASGFSIVFVLWMYRRGLITSIKTDVVQWSIIILGLILLSGMALFGGADTYTRAELTTSNLGWAFWSASILLSGPICDLQHWQRSEVPGAPKAYYLSSLLFAGFMAFDIFLSGYTFSPAMNIVLLIVLLSVTSSTIDSAAVALHELGGKRIGTIVALAMCLLWGVFADYGVLSLWSNVGYIRVPFALAIVAGGIWLLKRRKKDGKAETEKG